MSMKKNLFYVLMACCVALTATVFAACSSDDDDQTSYTYQMSFQSAMTDSGSNSKASGAITEALVLQIFQDKLNVSSTTFTKGSDDEVKTACEAAVEQLEGLNVSVTGYFAVTNVSTGTIVYQLYFDSGANSWGPNPYTWNGDTTQWKNN